MNKIFQAINALLTFAVFCSMLALTLAVQLSAVGALDRLGISPQHSFLSLNFVMIGVLATLLCYPRLRRLHPRKRRVGTPLSVDESTVGLPRQPTELTCKLLIIRRTEAVTALQTATKRFSVNEGAQ